MSIWHPGMQPSTGDVDDDETGEGRIYFMSMLNPHLFRDAILLGANVEDSLVYRWLESKGYRLEPFAPIIEKLRSAPEVGHRLRISYLIPGLNATKTLYRQADTNGVSIIDRMDRVALEAFGGEPFLFVANNKRKSSAIDGLRTVRKIPVVSHGLNAMRTITISTSRRR